MALAAALSTVPITLLLVILLSARRKAAAPPFVLGCVVGTFAVVVVAALAAQFLPDPQPRQADRWSAIMELLLGVVLVALGIRGWLGRSSGEDRHLPGWAVSAIDSIGGLRAFGLGMIIEFRPKSLLLACVASLQIHAAPRGVSSLALLLVYVAIATSTMTVPLLLTLISPDRMEPRLTRVSDRLSRDGALVSAVVIVMIGVVVIGSGLQNFG